MTTGNAPTIDELIASFSVTDAGKSVVGKAILASLERLKRLDSQPVPVEPVDIEYIHKFINSVPFGEYCPPEDMARAHGIIDSLTSALKLAQEERDEAIKREKSKHEQYSALLERHTKLAEKLEKAESINRRMVEQYRDLVVAAEKIGGKVTDASNLQISIADVLSMKETLTKLEES